MTRALITIDTELSASRQQAGMAWQDNLRHSLTGSTNVGDYGIGWQMDRMEAHGIRGVFFVDPMPGLIHGPDLVARMVEPILSRGHEVQVHIHTEWLQWAKDSPVDGRTGRNIGDFTLADQVALLGWARDTLVAAGAPGPNAFRAGNYGANDDTLRALARLGILWDSSYNADYAGRPCHITLPSETVDPVWREGVLEAPVAGIWDRPDHFRPAQVCALSVAEMVQGLTHAARDGAHSFIVVSHSFEMLSRDRMRPNRLVMKRFEALCAAIAADERVVASGFADLPVPTPSASAVRPRLAASHIRTAWRVAEQGFATLVYEKGLFPA
ncbi:hypothetical protein LWE61_19025 [Sphingobium sufflavum]|uniref:polysaccharide deacetylase family protein n=1 Tax=Sphingobium sufflavum TaxID=1129547 RepID=UPI001F41A744|nr:hypothetical protein [Sphingobium sufflavum]MCE7798628.1 hypothetical protein [Sphingobium sufflavum]